MVERGAHQVAVEEGTPVRHERGAQQPVVGSVGEHGLVVERVVAQISYRANPGPADGPVRLRLEGVERGHGTPIERPVLREQRAERLRDALGVPPDDVDLGLECLGRQHLRHLVLV